MERNCPTAVLLAATGSAWLAFSYPPFSMRRFILRARYIPTTDHPTHFAACPLDEFHLVSRKGASIKQVRNFFLEFLDPRVHKFTLPPLLSSSSTLNRLDLIDAPKIICTTHLLAI